MFEEGLTIMANLETEGFKKGTKELENAVKKLSAQVNRVSKQMTGGLKRFVAQIIGVGSAFQIISKGVSAFMSQNEELSQRMSAIWTAIGNLLGPIITQIIDWVSTAVSYFLGFLKLLGVTGKSASELSTKANKSVKELQRTLAGFDELNVLQDNSSSNGNDNNKQNPLKDLEPSEWMKKLAELLKNKMWDEAADLIIDKINSLIYTIQEKAYEAGRLIGEYLGGIIHIAARIIRDVDWKALGDTVARFFNGLIQNIDGKDLGTILVGKFVIAIGILTGFLEGLDWEKTADIIIDSVIGIFESLGEAIAEADFGKIGEGILTFFLKIWDRKDEIAHAIFDFLHEVWEAALQLLNGILSGDSEEEHPIIVSLRKLGEAIAQFSEVNASKLKEVWENVLKPFGEWLLDKGIPAAIDAITTEIERLSGLLSGDMNFVEFIGSLTTIETLLLGIGTAVGTIKLVTLISEIQNLSSTVGIVGKLGEVFAIVSSGAGNLFEAISLVFPSIGNLGAAIAGINPIVVGVIAILGAFIAEFVHLYNSNEEFRQKMDEIWSNIKSIFEGFFTSVKELFSGDIGIAEFAGRILGGLARLKQEINDGVIAFFEALGGDLWDKITGIWDTIKEAWQQVIDWWKEKAFEDGKFTFQGLLDGILEKITGIGDWIKTKILDPFVKGFRDAFDMHSPSKVMLGLGKDILQGLIDGITELLPSLETIKEKISEGWGNVKETVGGWWTSLKNWATGAGNEDTSKIDNLTRAVTDAENALRNFEASHAGASDTLNAFNESIDNVVRSLISASEGVEQSSAANEALRSSMDALKAKYAEIQAEEESAFGNAEREAELKSELTQIIADYVAALEQEGYVLDANGQFIKTIADETQKGADAVSQMADKEAEAADAVIAANKELDKVPETTDKSSEGYSQFAEDAKETTDNTEENTSEMVKLLKADWDELGRKITEKASEIKTVVAQEIESMHDNVRTTSEKMGADVKQNAEQMETNVIASFGRLTDESTSYMHQLLQNAQSIFGMLASYASICGADMMINFINGIVSMMPALIDTLVGVANTVDSYIGFSKPEKGPLSEADKYGPDMVELLAQGIEGGAGRLTAALNDIAETVAFQAPGIAGGAILPYGVAAATAGTSADSEGALTEIYERLISAINALENAAENNQFVLQFGDLRLLVKEITRIQRQMARTEGGY